MDATAKQRTRNEIQEKKAKLAELKRQRELRQSEFTASRHSIGESPDACIIAPTPSRAENREDLDKLIKKLVGDSRPGSTGPREGASPARGSRPTSEISAGQFGQDHAIPSSPSTAVQTVSTGIQTLSTEPVSSVLEKPSSPKAAIITYSKAVQTSDEWSPQRRRDSVGSESGNDGSPTRTRSNRNSKRLSRRERERDEELRQNLRKEIEDELKTTQQMVTNGAVQPVSSSENFPLRTLSNEELAAVSSSDVFMDFMERSTKVIERALDDHYDLLADYAQKGDQDIDEEDEDEGPARGKKGRRVKEVAQFYEERWSKKRMISDLGFSPKFPELILASYTKNPAAPHDPDGLIQIWNLHMRDRPEYTFHAQSDILTAKFSPFHPNIVIGGSYSGQILMWDTRQKSSPVQKTPLTGFGHTHPVYSLDIIGTQNAHNIISASTDGVVCGWSVDMLSRPQESLELATPPPAKTEDLAPTCIAFPHADPTYFLVGAEDGTIYPCHRYDRAGAKAGVDARLAYRGHSAPIMSLDFHPARGPLDLGDLVLSSSVDWTVKIWKARPPAATAVASAAATSTALSAANTTLGSGPSPGLGATTATSSALSAGGGSSQIAVPPLVELVREDLVYDARWSPVKPAVFALVEGSGALEVWDLNADREVPAAVARPSERIGSAFAGPAALRRSLNRLAWERNEGRRVAVGGLDGAVTVFEVGQGLGGLEGVRSEEWAGVKRLVAGWEREADAGVAGGVVGRDLNGRY